jgi:hypothetical protein
MRCCGVAVLGWSFLALLWLWFGFGFGFGRVSVPLRCSD